MDGVCVCVDVCGTCSDGGGGGGGGGCNAMIMETPIPAT